MYLDWPGLSMYFNNTNILCFDLSYKELASDSHISNSAGCVVNMLELSISYQIPACSSINIQSSSYEESIDIDRDQNISEHKLQGSNVELAE
jgi:hypothetical protein